ncbi:hypothetical protein PG996_012372 [Apiospora saccharicola]|uniref:Uncharacterized protein n=1 Tax=Apiospora saccharicola TaxID=335842 RepID=A0ABR1U2D9_9PEZI
MQDRVRKTKAPPRSFTETTIRSISQDILCEDYHAFLESELPRWTAHGVWHEPAELLGPTTKLPTALATLPNPSATSPEGHVGLEKAYLVVCQLESRMEHDMIRSRMALIQLHLEYTQMHEALRRPESDVVSTSTVGRGGSSHVIDRILNSIHEGWEALDQQRQAELRGKFHYRKKCGKRWAQLADALGRSILLLASAKLASAV